MENAPSASGQQPGVATKWQDALTAACQERSLGTPAFQLYSDRRGGRTAWSATVYISSDSAKARYWYDGTFVNNAKEDAAEVMLHKLQASGASQPQAAAGQQHPAEGGQQGGSQGYYQQ